MWLKFKTEDENLTRIAKLQQLLGISGILNFSGSARTARIVRHHSQHWLEKRSAIWVWETWVSSSIHSGPLVDNCSMRQSQGNFLDAGHTFHNLPGFRLKLLQEVATFRTWNRTIRIARFRIAGFSIQNRRFSATKVEKLHYSFPIRCFARGE